MSNSYPRNSQGQIDFKAINEAALCRLPELVENWIPGGRREGNEYVAASLAGGAGRSLSVNLASGLWADFASEVTGDRGGDPISLLAAVRGLPQGKAALELARELGLGTGHPRRSAQAAAKKAERRRIVASYDYVGPDGNLVFQVTRWEPKTFSQRRPDGNSGWISSVKDIELVPYRLPAVIAARFVFVVEGEKDADALAALGLTATCNAQGAGKFRAEYARWFAGKRVCILPDSDDAGRRHALDVARKLHGVAEAVKILELPGLLPKGDVSDWLAAGGSKAELAALAKATPEWSPDADPAPAPLDVPQADDSKPMVLLAPGSRSTVVDGVIIPHLRACGDFFERGGELVSLAPDGVLPMGVQSLQMELDRRFEILLQRKKGPVREDCPRTIAEGVFYSRHRWDFASLKARITAPTLDLKTGRLIERPGFDRETGLFLDYDGRCPDVPETPNLDDVRAAVNVLWRPFAEFPFRSALDASVVFGLLLLATVRQALPTAPGHAVNAPAAGSGKTLLAMCACRLAGARFPTVLPGVDGDELRKRLLTIGRLAVLGAVFDNLFGRFGSDALCAWLTSPWFEDRILGASASVRVPTSMMLLLTGNNLILVGDLCRRVLPAHLDPQCETPWRRAFAVDPLEHVEKHRLEMVAAGLTVLRWALGRPRSFCDRTASFELWSDTVRHAVVEVGREGFMELPDPCNAIDTSFETDPDTLKLGALLAAWDAHGFDRPQSVAEILDACGRAPDLEDAVDEIAGERGQINRRRLGRWIESRAGRIVNGLRFRRAGTRQGVSLWAVEKTHETPVSVGVVGDVGFFPPTRAEKNSGDDSRTHTTENTRGGLGSNISHETPKTHGRDEALI